MIYLSCDGSFKGRMGGMAVVAPGGVPPSPGVQVCPIPGTNLEAYVASGPCSSVNEAETMAMAMAVEIASRLLESISGEVVEISTDSLMTLEGVVHGRGNLRGKEAVRRLLDRHRERIIISKVKAHRGNRDNELADKWSKRARQKAERERRYDGRRSKMRMPYDNRGRSNGYDIDGELSGFDFGGGNMKEADILKQTEAMLEEKGDDVWAVITKDGRIVPKNVAYKSGDKTPTELYKDRVWG